MSVKNRENFQMKPQVRNDPYFICRQACLADTDYGVKLCLTLPPRYWTINSIIVCGESTLRGQYFCTESVRLPCTFVYCTGFVLICITCIGRNDCSMLVIYIRCLSLVVTELVLLCWYFVAWSSPSDMGRNFAPLQ